MKKNEICFGQGLFSIARLSFVMSFVALALVTSSALAAVPVVGVSEYSSIKDADCNMIAISDETSEMDFFKSVCPGPKGYLVKYLGGDIRSWIGLMAPGEDYDLENHFYGPMMQGAGGQFPNVHGTRLEWRYVDGKLAALIAQMMAQNPDDLSTVVNFVVIRLDTTDLKKSCLIGAVDSGAGRGAGVEVQEKANDVARAIADDLMAKCL